MIKEQNCTQMWVGGHAWRLHLQVEGGFCERQHAMPARRHLQSPGMSACLRCLPSAARHHISHARAVSQSCFGLACGHSHRPARRGCCDKLRA